MPRKKSDENLAKVISSNISLEDFDLLQRYAKLYYNHNKLKQPTISHLVRYLLNNWANQIRDKEEQKRKKPITKFYTSDPTYLRTHPGLQARLANKTQTTEG
jgi:hypothetical protein